MPIRAGEITWNEGELAKYVNIGTIQHFIVNEHERCLFIRDGKIMQVFGPGRHLTASLPIFGRVSFVYVSLRPFQLKWGLPETMSKDNVRVGAFGTIELQITKPELFYAQVLGGSGKQVYTVNDLRDDVLDNIQSVIRSELAQLDIKQIYIERDILISVVRTKLQELFANMGIDYKRLEIQGINIPEEVKQALESLKIHEITTIKKKTDMQLELEKLKAAQQSGIDALKLKEMELLEKDPSILAKKYEAEAYRDALQTAKTQNVNIGMSMPPVQYQQPQVVQQQPAQAPQQPQQSQPSDPLEEKLMKLKNLLDKGLITQEEYDQKKKEILSSL